MPLKTVGDDTRWTEKWPKKTVSEIVHVIQAQKWPIFANERENWSIFGVCIT